MTGNSMEEVWNDISLASLRDFPKTTTTASNTNHCARHAMSFQDFLATPINKNTLSGVASSARPSSLRPHPATMLSLNSGSDFQYTEISSSVVPSSEMNSHARAGTLTFDSCRNSSPFDPLLGASSVFSSICKRSQENSDVSGGDRKHKRMIKNRESAARSRARKQAYTTELEQEVAHLLEENAKLRRQQEKDLLISYQKSIPSIELQRLHFEKYIFIKWFVTRGEKWQVRKGQGPCCLNPKPPDQWT